MAPRYQAHYKSSLERYAAKKLGKKPIRDITVEAVEAAVGYLLQAASRSEWTGDPQSLIPEAFREGRHAALGMADFLGRRECPGWEETSLELAARYPDALEFRPIEAVAALCLVIKAASTTSGGICPISFDRMNQIADKMQSFVKRMLQVSFADEHDRGAHLNNACVLLRLCDRYVVVDDLLRSAGSLADAEPNFRRLKALALVRKDTLGEAGRWPPCPNRATTHRCAAPCARPLSDPAICLAVDGDLREFCGKPG